MSIQGQRFVFTLNNYTDAHIEHLRILGTDDGTSYLVFGKEVGDSGTPHLQGFITLKKRKRFTAVLALFIGNPHVEQARGTNLQAADYCKKDGSFEEFGNIPKAGKIKQIDLFIEWVSNRDTKPTKEDVAAEFPHIFMHNKRFMEYIDVKFPNTFNIEGDYRAYQQSLADLLDGPTNDRKINFIVDERGNTGKSWFIKKFCSTHPDDVQIFSLGKRDDIAYSIDVSKKYFFFDLPRSGLEFFQYSILESIKDRIIFSPKYESQTKVLSHDAHVVVFMNQSPDMTKLSRDRYNVINWVSI